MNTLLSPAERKNEGQEGIGVNTKSSTGFHAVLELNAWNKRDFLAYHYLK